MQTCHHIDLNDLKLGKATLHFNCLAALININTFFHNESHHFASFTHCFCFLIVSALQLCFPGCWRVAPSVVRGLCHAAARSSGLERRLDFLSNRRDRLCCVILWLLRCLGAIALSLGVGKLAEAEVSEMVSFQLINL